MLTVHKQRIKKMAAHYQSLLYSFVYLSKTIALSFKKMFYTITHYNKGKRGKRQRMWKQQGIVLVKYFKAEIPGRRKEGMAQSSPLLPFLIRLLISFWGRIATLRFCNSQEISIS